MLRSLRSRLLIVGVVPVVVAVSVSAILTVRSVSTFAQAQRAEKRVQQQQELQRIATGLSRLYGRQVRPAVLGQANDTVLKADVEAAVGARLFYLPRTAHGLFDASQLGLDPMRMEERLPRALRRDLDAGKAVVVPPDLLPRAFAGDVVAARGVFVTDTGDPDGGAPFGYLVVASPLAQVASPEGALRRALVPAFAIGLAVAIILALAVVLRLERPLKRLASAARAFARGDDDVPLDTDRPDEIGMVNHAFDEMRRNLADARATEREFLMRISHDLKTPLTAIRGQVEALADGVYEDEDEHQLAYAAILDEAGRLERLVGDLVDLARLQARRFGLASEEVDLGILLDQVVAGQVAQARERDIEISLQARSLPVIVGDGDRILQIVGNLLRNAVRWTPDEGTVLVSALAQDGRLWITVDDSGPGIPRDKRARIFDAYYTEDGAGVGLGLAIARELALAMGGSVQVADAPAPQGGARFIVELPCTPVRSSASV